MEETKKSNNIGKILLVLILIIAATIGGWFIGYKGLIIKHPETKCAVEKEENKEQQPVEKEEVAFAEGDIYNVEFFVSELNKAFVSQDNIAINWPVYEEAKAIYDKDNKEIDLVITDEDGTITETCKVEEFEDNGKKYNTLVCGYFVEQATYDLSLIIDFYADLYATNKNIEQLRDKVVGIPTAPIFYYELVLSDESVKVQNKEEQDAYKVKDLTKPAIETCYYEAGDKKAYKNFVIIPLHDNTYNILGESFK